MQRIEWVNKVKGFAMLCVVFGHAITGNIRNSSSILGHVYDYIYLFHMPLFFFFAGFLYQCNESKYLKKGIQNFIKQKFKALMVPYYAYSIITYTVILLLGYVPFIGNILISAGYKVGTFAESARQILLWQNSLDQHLWFIYALFIVFVMNIMVSKFKVNDIFLLLLVIVLHCLTLRSGWDIVQRIFAYQVYFVCGKLMNKHNIFELSKKNKMLIFVCTLAVALSITKMCIIHVIFDNYVFTILKALFSIVVSLAMILAICMCFMRFKNDFFDRIFEKVYMYNFEIYILHQPFIVSGMVIVLTKILGMNSVGFIVITATVMGIVLSIMIAKVLYRIKPMRVVLFGK
ncbi:MAG: acyltransferase [Firmicutes bacterium]|nr:acyltransferase [Bacillota bacterium]